MFNRWNDDMGWHAAVDLRNFLLHALVSSSWSTGSPSSLLFGKPGTFLLVVPRDWLFSLCRMLELTVFPNVSALLIRIKSTFCVAEVSQILGCLWTWVAACFEECPSHQIAWNTSNCLESKERILDFQRLVPVSSQECWSTVTVVSLNHLRAKAMMNTPVEGVSVFRDQRNLDLIKTRRHKRTTRSFSDAKLCGQVV